MDPNQSIYIYIYGYAKLTRPFKKIPQEEPRQTKSARNYRRFIVEMSNDAGIEPVRYLGGDVVLSRHGDMGQWMLMGKFTSGAQFPLHPAISLNSKNQGIQPIFIDSWDERSDNLMGIYWIYWLYPPEDGGILPNKWWFHNVYIVVQKWRMP